MEWVQRRWAFYLRIERSDPARSSFTVVDHAHGPAPELRHFEAQDIAAQGGEVRVQIDSVGHDHAAAVRVVERDPACDDVIERDRVEPSDRKLARDLARDE